MRDEFETETLSGRAIAEVAHLLQKLKSIITRSKGYQSRHFRLIEFQVLVSSCRISDRRLQFSEHPLTGFLGEAGNATYCEGQSECCASIGVEVQEKQIHCLNSSEG